MSRSPRVWAAAAGLAAVACHAAPQTDLRPIPRQNVLLITIDTLRADALGCYGGRAATPALDRLASEGVRFDFAHAHAVTTLTSHASILTGLYPYQHGVRDNSGYRVAADARTAATLLKSAGYATAAFVGAFPLHSRFGLGRGFDVYDDRFGETQAPTDFVMPERPATAVVALARKWLTNPQSPIPNPWFLWLHVFDPHAPYRPPPPFDAQYASAPYLGEVAAVDAALGPLLDDVRAGGRPTLAIVTGDHGEGLGDHGELTHGFFAYESTLRVPLIVAELASARAAAETSHASARHVDILPTILDAVGAPIPSDLPGRSLLAASARRDADARSSYFEAMSGTLTLGSAPLTGVLLGHDKYIDLPLPERYDLSADPGETANLAGRDAARDRAAMAVLRDFKAAPPGHRVAEDAEAVARLRALGYVSTAAAPKTHYGDADDPKRLIDVEQAIHRAVDAFTAGRPAEAIQIYRQILERRPDVAIVYRHLAFVERQAGDAPGAIATLRAAMQHGVTDPKAVAELGGYLTDAGRAADAIRVLEPIAAEPGVDPDALNALGIAYASAGRRDAAARTFERVLTIDPGSSVPLENLGVLALERGDPSTARVRFEQAAALAPRSSRAFGGLGSAYSRLGDRQRAIAALTTAVELDPRNTDALYNLGVTLARAGQIADARPYLERFLKTAPAAGNERERREVSDLLTNGRRGSP